ncbi:MAG: hypothetical protein ABI779_26360 [Acidobacteriota bacterium]
MTKLRTLNERGIAEFRGYLQQIRDGAEFRASPAILYLDDYSSPITSRTEGLPRTIEIEPRPFANKYDAGQSLAQLLGELPPSVTSDPGLWSWLALYSFDQLSPVDAEGRRRPREDYHYIPSDESGWLRDRHLLAGPYKLFTLHRQYSRLLLHPPVHQHGAFVYDLGHRRDLITNRGLIEALDLLYWDPRRHRPKRGATTTTNPGNLRRLITVVQQLDFNYDLYGMRAEEILTLLPAEFDGWKPPLWIED